MEDQYDGDTVELIDYLRTMWWGKWIILGCLVVAVGLSVLFVSLKPTTYSGSTELSLREYVTATLAECEGKGEGEGEHLAMMSTMELTLKSVAGAVPGITASVVGNRITIMLSRSNATSTDAVRESLTQAVTELGQQVILAIAEELSYLARTTEIKQSSLAMQLDILQQQLNEEQASSGTSVLEALAGEIAALRVQLAQQQVILDTLESSEPSELFVLSPIGEPTITTSAPNRKTTIAVAGFLGLMIGVLLAFFVHYLLQIRARERSLEASDE